MSPLDGKRELQRPQIHARISHREGGEDVALDGGPYVCIDGGRLWSHVLTMSDSRYSFGEDTRSETLRLAAVEHPFEGESQAALREVGVGTGWCC